MKIFGEFSTASRREALLVGGHTYEARWEEDTGFVQVPGLTEYNVRIDDDAGDAMVFMRWLVADVEALGGKDGLLEALESYSPDAADWATCLAKNCGDCAPFVVRQHGALALLQLIAAEPHHQRRGLNVPLARAFAETVLVRLGVRAIWIKPVPLAEHPPTGIFKPIDAPDTAAFNEAVERLARHYRRSLDAQPACPDYLRAPLAGKKDPDHTQ